MLTVGLPILTFVIGVVVTFGFDLYMKRPKLQLSGAGGSSGLTSAEWGLVIANRPGWFGPRAGATVIFGKEISGDFRWGIEVPRRPALACRAYLRDKATNDVVQMLWWRNTDGSLARSVDIPNGGEARLMLFRRDSTSEYFIFDSADGTTPSKSAAVFSDSHDFVVEIQQGFNGHTNRRFNVPVTKRYDGRFYTSNSLF